MSSDAWAVRAEGLSKVYKIDHLAERYTALRDVISRRVRGILRPRIPVQPPHEDFWALRDVSFDLARGDRLGIIGRNGAGKTTLLKLLSRITKPTEGRVRLRGRVVSLLEVGTGFHPELTGRENIFLNGAILGMSREEIRGKFDEIVAFAEVERFLDTPVKRYSSGMYVRLAFSVAAHLEPEILLVDEVLAVGDAAFQKKCLGKMGEVGRSGRTLIFISHNMSFIQRICNRGLLLDKGRIEAQGSVEDVVHQYLARQEREQSRVDLTRFINRYDPEQRLVVEWIELTNGVHGSFAVPWDEPLRMRLHIRTRTRLSNLSLAVGCESVDGAQLFTVRSTDDHTKLFNFDEPGEHEIDITIEHPLRAGAYNLSLGVSMGDAIYYYNAQAAQLEIIGFGKKPYLERNIGMIHCQSEWETHRAA